MDTPRLTEVPREQLPEQPRRFNAALFFANKDRVSRLCMTALIVSRVCNGLQIVTLLVLLNRKDSVTIVDEDGGIKVGSSKSLAEAKEFHQRLAFQATEALFLRNPRDFDEPELLQGLFSRPSRVLTPTRWCRMAPIPTARTWRDFTCRTTTSPTPRTALWTPRSDAARLPPHVR